MQGSFDPILVTLSFVVAVFASYTALELAKRVARVRGVAAKLWLVAGAASMGMGIWTMHFVGMLAFSMDMPFEYDVPLTALSLVVGMLASGFAIHVGSQRHVSTSQIVFSGVILGVGIVSMHYVGMEAMEMQALIVYDPWLVALSVAIAVVAATAAIWISFTLARPVNHRLRKYRFVAAVVMGVAICGMHYTGMFAASYEPLPGVAMVHSDDAQSNWMAATLGIAALVILGITHLTIFFDYRLAAERRIGDRAQQKAIRLSEILDDASNEIYVVDPQTLKFVSVNRGAVDNLGYERSVLETMTPIDITPALTREAMLRRIAPLLSGETRLLEFDTTHEREDGTTYPVQVSLQLSKASSEPVLVAIMADVTERRNLEAQVAQSRKLESIGQLAAGIAHEINTPAQYVGDNTRFLQSAFSDLSAVVQSYEDYVEEVRRTCSPDVSSEELDQSLKTADMEYLREEVPLALEQALDGISRISSIVLAMKAFSHPGGNDQELVNLNEIIANTIVVASNEWKYVAEVEAEYDDTLPPVSCMPQDISQVVLNLIVNAAHAIDEQRGAAKGPLGKITIRTRQLASHAEICISDTGNGVPAEIRDRIFDPFFTTKEVGKGTGQGLSMAHATVVEMHGGEFTLLSPDGEGATFVIRLPFEGAASAPEKSEVIEESIA